MDYPEEEFQTVNAEKELNNAKERLVLGLQGKVISESVITFSKYPGNLISIETSKGQYFKIKIVLVNRRLYQIVASSSKDTFDEKIHVLKDKKNQASGNDAGRQIKIPDAAR